MRLLVVNAGSSTLKLSVIDDSDGAAETAHLASPQDAETLTALARFADANANVDAVAHRIVHGGPLLSAPVMVDDRVRTQLDIAAELAPLHVPPALRILDALRQQLHVP